MINNLLENIKEKKRILVKTVIARPVNKARMPLLLSRCHAPQSCFHFTHTEIFIRFILLLLLNSS